MVSSVWKGERRGGDDGILSLMLALVVVFGLVDYR